MPLTPLSTYGGTFPDINDPTTFDARMTTWQSFFDTFDNEIATFVTEFNTALNDNGTVLDSAAEATRRATNATVPILTAGTGAAYTVAAAVTITSLVANEPVALRTHTTNAAGATINVDGLGAVEIRKINNAGVLVALEGNEFSPYDEHVFVYDGTYWVVQTQILRELLGGQVLVPLASQAFDFDTMLEGGEHKVTGSWANGPNGAAASSYTGLMKTMISDELVYQVLLTADSTWARTGSVASSSVTWGAWQPLGSSTLTPVVASGQTEIDFTGIPQEAKRINVMFRGLQVVTASGHDILVQGLIGGVPDTTGYNSYSSVVGGAGSSSTSGFRLALQNSSRAIHGKLELIRQASDANNWVGSGSHFLSTGSMGVSGGSAEFSGAVTGIRVTNISGNPITSGTVNVAYEV